MPRSSRLDTPGLLQGIERREIFTDDVDREDFIERLSDLLPEAGTQCYAWSFLSNACYVELDINHGGNQRPGIARCTGFTQNSTDPIQEIVPVGIAQKDPLFFRGMRTSYHIHSKSESDKMV